MQQSFDYIGYTLVQELTENYHYMIFDNKGAFRVHAACTKKIETQEEAEQHIDSYLKLLERISKNAKQSNHNGQDNKRPGNKAITERNGSSAILGSGGQTAEERREVG